MKVRKQFEFINSFGNKNVFLTEAFYNEVCAIITDFLKEELVMNGCHKRFIEMLNNLDNEYEVSMLLIDGTEEWALSILKNGTDLDFGEYPNGKTDEELIDWYSDVYYPKTKIGSYLIKTIDDPITDVEDDFGNHNVFFVKKYYDFVNLLVTDFFDQKVENNEEHSYFMNVLKTVGNYRDSFEEVNKIEPYQWALRIINDSEEVEEITDEKRNKYNEFLYSYLHANEIENFVVSKK